LVWTKYDVNKEVNNGRGPVDFKVSAGHFDQTIIEFKLGSNTHLKKNLEKQIDVYAKANHNPSKIVVITCLTDKQEVRVKKILFALNIHTSKKMKIVLIDARHDNKPSASVA